MLVDDRGGFDISVNSLPAAAAAAAAAA